MIGLLAAIAGTLVVFYAGIKFLLVLQERSIIEFNKHVEGLVSTARHEIDIARHVFRPDFESRRSEIQELIEMVGEEFGSELSSNKREIYWLRMLVRTLEEEREWLAKIGGLAINEDQAA